MKRASHTLLILLLCSLFVTFSCQREISFKPKAESFTTEVAKEWWYGVFKKSDEYKQINWKSPIAPPQGSSTIKLPRWKSAISYKKAGNQIIELPLVFKTSNIILPDMQNLYKTASGIRLAKSAIHKLILIQKQNGERIVRVCSIIPTEEYAKKCNYDISNIQTNSLPINFEGYFLITGWDLKIINLVKVSDGRMKKAIKIISGSEIEHFQNKQQFSNNQICPEPIWVPAVIWVCAYPNSGDDIADNEACQENGNWTESQTGGAYEVPECYDEETEQDEIQVLNDCLENNSNEDCYCYIFGIGCPIDPEDGNETLPIIVNSVDNPCLKSNVENAISLDCRNKISNFINTVFLDNENLILYFSDNEFNAGPHVGWDSYSGTQPLSDSRIKTTIILNNLLLNNASQEYITATILHEAVHAWIDYQYGHGSPEANIQHNLMAQNDRFNMMRDALMEMFPNLSLQAATDLTWGGLKNTNAFSQLSATEQQRILQINYNYRERINNTGTACSN